MSSTRETILAAVKSILTTANVASGRIYRERQEQIATLPAVEITFTANGGDETCLGIMDHNLTVNVAVLAKGDTPSTAADATLLAAHVALQADLSLGLGNDVQMGARYEADDEPGDLDYIRVTHRYTVIYRTATGSF